MAEIEHTAGKRGLTKLTGPQSIVLNDAEASGLIFRGQHNDICNELRRLGLVKYDPQPSLYPNSNPNPRTAWRLTDAGRALSKATPTAGKSKGE